MVCAITSLISFITSNSKRVFRAGKRSMNSTHSSMPSVAARTGVTARIENGIGVPSRHAA